MDSVIITYAVLDYSGKLMRRFFSIEEARALSDRHCNTHPVAIRREWWRIDKDETSIIQTHAFGVLTGGTDLDFPPALDIAGSRA